MKGQGRGNQVDIEQAPSRDDLDSIRLMVGVIALTLSLIKLKVTRDLLGRAIPINLGEI